ncbi:hypothetical protein J6590_075995 [Homalodisca vitripennis]|nr:hypothetical protein J6590_075995 [Homalodisca vitripennis]
MNLSCIFIHQFNPSIYLDCILFSKELKNSNEYGVVAKRLMKPSPDEFPFVPDSYGQSSQMGVGE